MTFRAKCRIIEVRDTQSMTTKQPGFVETKSVRLQPVYGGDEDEANKQWSKWTPSGELALTITNPAVFPDLVIGRTFFVDFTPVE